MPWKAVLAGGSAVGEMGDARASGTTESLMVGA